MSVTDVGWKPLAAKRWAAKSISSLRRRAPLGVCRRSTIATTLRASPRPGQSSRLDALVPLRSATAHRRGYRWRHGLLDLEGDPYAGVLLAVAGKGGGPGARAPSWPGSAGGQPPIVLRLVLPPAGAAPAGHLRGQGRVLRELAHFVVLPGCRADTHEPERRGCL